MTDSDSKKEPPEINGQKETPDKPAEQQPITARPRMRITSRTPMGWGFWEQERTRF